VKFDAHLAQAAAGGNNNPYRGLLAYIWCCAEQVEPQQYSCKQQGKNKQTGEQYFFHGGRFQGPWLSFRLLPVQG